LIDLLSISFELLDSDLEIAIYALA